MVDYRLDALSPRSFEHLVQALALSAITSSLVPFGDGPDGGREATFDGQTQYGPEGDRWAGYGIIQVKFRQRPTSGDGHWVEKELAKELAAYAAPTTSRSIPEYFILATNATLTAVQNTGSKDRVLRLLRDFTAKHQLKDFDLWDYDKIRVLLDNNEDVRNAYLAWITPGDVLAELARQLGRSKHNQYKILVNLLQKDLATDQFAKLEQAGHSADEAIPLSQVFIDLPVSIEPGAHSGPSGAGPRELADERYFASTVVDAARQRLVEQDNRDDTSGHGRWMGRYVLIGGPGQGKTTLGQLVCQAFRAALLVDVDPKLIDTTARSVIDEFVRQWEQERIPQPKARRLPFRIVLSEYAQKLAEGEISGVLDYLAKYVRRRTTGSFDDADVLALMRTYPTIIVLDGLDEVPLSTNREEVLASVRDFQIDTTTEEVDVLIVATSRPQGYNEDFSPSLYEHLYLIPLSSRIALEYAKRLTQIRFGQDAARFDKVIGRLERAAAGGATARLMRSPLQVTIMTLLVDRMGQPPQERWTLFNAYYNLIYQREIEREIPAAEVLRDYRHDIDVIHTRVGLVLQIESERSGGTDARLTSAQFSAIVKAYLREEGHDGESLAALQRSIIDAAANRLVFLVGVESGRVGFEIRSLQEFMAAEGLMDGEDATVQARLRQIAPIENWRNVFLFAAGKCFSERRHLRDTICQVCLELNDDTADPVNMATLSGSRLALDLLEDGPAARHPVMCRTLTRLALRLLEDPSPGIPERLLSVQQARTMEIYTEELETRLRQAQPTIDAVATAARLCDLTPTLPHPFRELSGSSLSRDDDALLWRLLALDDGRPGLVQDFLLRELPLRSPSELVHMVNAGPAYRREGYSATSMPEWLQQFLTLSRRHGKRLRVPIFGRSRRLGELLVVALRQGRGAQKAPLELPSGTAWDLLRLVYSFSQSPSKARLAEALEASRTAAAGDLAFAVSEAGWPLAQALVMGRRSGNWLDLAEKARTGGLGDVDEWESQELSLARGLTLEDLADRSDLLNAGGVVVEGRDDDTIEEFLDFVDAIKSDDKSQLLLEVFHAAAMWARHGVSGTRRWVPRYLAMLPMSNFSSVFVLDSFAYLDVESVGEGELDACLENLGSSAFVPGIRVEAITNLSHALQEAWGRTKSLRLLPAFGICAQRSDVDPVVLPSIGDLSRDGLSAEMLLGVVLIGLRHHGKVGRYLTDIERLACSDEFDPDALLTVLKASCDSVEAYERQVLELYRDILATSVKMSAMRELGRLVSARRSQLDDEGVWSHLCLPRSLRGVVVDIG
jgi:hypothetical protein